MKESSNIKIHEKIVQYSDITDKKVLEIGCGAGRISSLLATKCETLVAIDPDENAINKAKTTISGVNFKIGSGEKINFPSSTFDIVIFTLSLHHQDSSKALNEASRVVKNEGKILVIEPVIDGELEQVFSFVHNENAEKIEALNSIETCMLPVIESEFFSAEWLFENKNDLFQSLFEYYNVPFDSNTANNITFFLGEKIKLSPIILEDKMMIQVLAQKY